MNKMLPDLETLQMEARLFAGTLSKRESHATLVTLTGDLGAGKTSFTQGIAQELGVLDPITSPTFVLEKIYELPAGKAFSHLVHIDAYRLEGDTSLTPLRFKEVYSNPEYLIVLEWPELVEDQLPAPDYKIRLNIIGEGREISYA